MHSPPIKYIVSLYFSRVDDAHNWIYKYSLKKIGTDFWTLEFFELRLRPGTIKWYIDVSNGM